MPVPEDLDRVALERRVLVRGDNALGRGGRRRSRRFRRGSMLLAAAAIAGEAMGVRLRALLEKLRDLFEMGDLTRAEYVRRRDDLQAELASLKAAPTPVVNASETIPSLVDDWDQFDAGKRRQVLETIFTDIVVEDGRLASATPRPGWLDYIERSGVLDLLVWRRRRESNPR